MFTWSDRINDWAYSVGANFVWSKNKVLKWNQVKHGEEYRYTVGRSTDAMMGLVAVVLTGSGCQARITSGRIVCRMITV